MLDSFSPESAFGMAGTDQTGYSFDVDLTADTIPDATITVQGYNTDEVPEMDTYVATVDYFDTSLADFSITTTLLDTDDYQQFDTAVSSIDIGIDGIEDACFTETIDEDALSANHTEDHCINNEMISAKWLYTPNRPESLTYENMSPLDIVDSSERFLGDPAGALRYWEHQEGNTCALHTQRAIIEELTGRNLDINDMVGIAEHHGWYDNGTTLANVSKMMDYYGVPNSGVQFGGTVDTLLECARSNGRMLVNVDAAETWQQGWNLPFQMNHALEFIGLDYGDPNNPYDTRVIVNDSGTADGCGAYIPLDQFMDAWADTGCSYVTAYSA